MAEHPMAEACVCPPELDEIDLIALADHEAPHDVLAHVAVCPHCRERAAVIAELQGQLRAHLYRLFCPPTEDLADFLQGLLSPESRGRVLAHMAECIHCQEELAMLEGVSSGYPAAPPGGPPGPICVAPTGAAAAAGRAALDEPPQAPLTAAWPPSQLCFSGTPSGFSLLRIHDHEVIVDAHHVI
jgi:anti-sigma factor RsiW